MAEDGSSNPFSSFWKRSVDKLPPKELVFLPPNETSHKSDHGPIDSEASDVTTKQLRRAQVRKAQTEHRQRKKNYVKHLEQDVINLRKMIATTHKESASMETENDSIKTILWSNNLPTSNLPMARHRQSDQPLRVYSGPWPLPNSPLEQARPCKDMGLMLGTSVTIDFDYTIDASCLQAYHSSTNEPEILINTPTMFNFPANAFADGCGIASHTPDLLKPVPSEQSRVPLDLKTAERAINFILALEHPCRMHFRPIPADFSPKGSPTGHELMASTSLYAHAPPYVFANPSEVAWDIPSSPVTELQKLREMNESLPKRDSDITPVQAWFLLAEKYDMSVLLGNEDADRRDKAQREEGFLGQLKRELSTLVECFGFGAVMDRLTFWEVAERVDLTRNCKM